ncbi:MAG: hypothetical protein ACI9XO_002865 [Paraglaciecola sp.]|jgi:hypothetical protein
MRLRFLIFVFFLSFQTAKSQSLEFGLSAGVSIYNGDLSPQNYIKYIKYLGDIQPAGGVFLRGAVHPKLAIRGSFSIGSFSADDKGRANESRGLKFKSPLIELAVVGEIHPFRNSRNMRGRHFSPYLFGGVATFFFNPKTDYQGETVELQPIGTEGQGLANAPDKYSRVQFSIPIGVGLHLQINNRLSIGGEFGARKLFTDYLDDVGSREVNYGILVSGNGTTAGELSIRNPANRPTEPSNNTYTRGKNLLDWYYIGGVTLGFKIHSGGRNGQLGCPGF